MRKRFYEFTNNKKVFKTTYILSSIFCIFALVSGLHVRYDDSSLNASKWKGLFLGCVIEAFVLLVVYLLCNVADILALGVIVFVLYILHIILFGVLYKVD